MWSQRLLQEASRDEGPFSAPNPKGSAMDLGDSHLHRRGQRTSEQYLRRWLGWLLRGLENCWLRGPRNLCGRNCCRCICLSGAKEGNEWVPLVAKLWYLIWTLQHDL